MQAAFTVGWSLAGEVEDDFKSFLYTEDLPELGFASHANNIQWETLRYNCGLAECTNRYLHWPVLP